MKEFNYLNYHTEYSCKGDIEKDFRPEACFGKIFSCGRASIEETYVIRLYKGDCVLKERKNNACFVGKEEIRRHIILAKEIVGKFTYKIDEGQDGDKSFYDVTVKMNGDRLNHQYILTWVRYLYEYPFNMILADANRLKGEKGFKRETIANLFVLISSCFPDSFDRDIHLISWGTDKLLTKKETVDRIKDLIERGDRKLNHIYTNIKGKKNISGDYKNLEYWNSDEGFKERFNYYKQYYSKLKKKNERV